MSNDERFEPTDDDLEAVAGWTHAQYVREYEAYTLGKAAAEERFGNWKLGLGYALDVEVLS